MELHLTKVAGTQGIPAIDFYRSVRGEEVFVPRNECYVANTQTFSKYRDSTELLIDMMSKTSTRVCGLSSWLAMMAAASFRTADDRRANGLACAGL